MSVTNFYWFTSAPAGPIPTLAAGQLILHGGLIDAPILPVIATAYLNVYPGAITVPPDVLEPLDVIGGSGRYPVGAR